MMTLTGPEAPPASGGPAKQLVVLLHGLGADGSDLISLSPHLSAACPDAHFVSPDAPFPCDMAPYGRQWFSLQDRDPQALLGGVRLAAPILEGFLEDQQSRFGLSDAETFLIGFSQGTMTSLHVGPRRKQALGGIIGFSGALLASDLLSEETLSKPPILLIHGDADPIVPVQATPAAASALQDAGFEVESLIEAGLPHSIGPQGLQKAIAFLAQYCS